MELAGKMQPLLEKARENATELRSLLSNLMGKLSMHLAMEDKALYPGLFESPDPKIREVSKRFFEEMGDIKGVVEQYNKKWPIPDRTRPGWILPRDKTDFIRPGQPGGTGERRVVSVGGVRGEVQVEWYLDKPRANGIFVSPLLLAFVEKC